MTTKNTDVVLTQIQQTLASATQLFPGFARRESQMKMANDIRKVMGIDGAKVIACEAGTGVGKTFGYLLSVVPSALAQGKKVVISTATVALQEQIIKKDLPLFQTVFPKPLSFMFVKGRQRFLCREKLIAATSNQQMDLEMEAALFTSQPNSDDLAGLQEMALAVQDGRWSGDIDEWCGAPVCAEILNCLIGDSHSCKKSFANHKDCAYHKQRVDMDSADIIVANHALVAADLLRGGGILLPSAEDAIYVFDEAHQWPSIMCSASAGHLSLPGVSSMLLSLDKRLVHYHGFDCLVERVTQARETLENVTAGVHETQQWCSERLEHFFAGGKEMHRFEQGVLPSSLQSLATSLKTVLVRLNGYLHKISTIMSEDGQFQDSALSELGFYRSRLDDYIKCLKLLTLSRDSGVPPAKWVEFDAQKSQVRFGASEVNSGDFLREQLWECNSGIVLTSATLQSLGSFDFFIEQCGLQGVSAWFRRYSSPFDYAKQAKLIIPSDLPFEPNHVHFEMWLMDHLYQYLQGQQSTLVLFTKRSLMYKVRDKIEAQLTKENTLLQCQGDASRERVISNHKSALRSGANSVIFGLNSYSEGLDLQGELLENLIIVKLPFEPLEDPISAALQEFETLCGRNPFMTISLPDASRALIQAVGRLIRTETDTGRCVILDKRLMTKRYGESLINSLPPFKRCANLE